MLNAGFPHRQNAGQHVLAELGSARRRVRTSSERFTKAQPDTANARAHAETVRATNRPLTDQTTRTRTRRVGTQHSAGLARVRLGLARERRTARLWSMQRNGGVVSLPWAACDGSILRGKRTRNSAVRNRGRHTCAKMRRTHSECSETSDEPATTAQPRSRRDSLQGQ